MATGTSKELPPAVIFSAAKFLSLRKRLRARTPGKVGARIFLQELPYIHTGCTRWAFRGPISRVVNRPMATSGYRPCLCREDRSEFTNLSGQARSECPKLGLRGSQGVNRGAYL